MVFLLALATVLAIGLIGGNARLGRRAFLIGGIAPLATAGWVVAHLGGIVDGHPVTERIEWVEGLGLALDIRVDGFAALMALVVSGIGVLIFAYAHQYFADDSPDTGRLAGLLVLFAGSMLGLVVADNLLFLYTCWELTSITSFFLIGNIHRSSHARAAALQALLTTTFGSLAMLGGFVVIGEAAGTYRLQAILADPPGGTAVTVALVLVLLGAATKSAQVPFHAWLPAAMVAPTPVSAYLHSATMVTAGVVLVARFAPAFATVGMWRPAVIAMGLATMALGGLRALRQTDLKLLLAFGTVSQLGFMMVLFGAGTAAAATAGCVLMLAHAVFKAALFMVVGILDHQTGTRDLRNLPVLGRGWGVVRVSGVVAAASMAGVPLMFGFIAKELAYGAFSHGSGSGSIAHAPLVLAGIVAGSVLTVAYSARFAWGAFWAAGARARAAGHPVEEATAPAPSSWFVGPVAVLAAVTVVLGVAPQLIDGLVGAATHALVPTAHVEHLALWHGWNLALGLSVLTLALGIGLFVVRTPVGELLGIGRRVPSSSDAYLGVLRWLNRGADAVTGLVQRGSLPVYLGVILLTASLLPGWALLRGGWPGWPQLVDTWAHLPAAVLLVGAALAAAAARSRLQAALFLGVAGYAMAGFFIIQGAPDLALTQVAVETLSTVLFVLALRRLPDRFGGRVVVGRRLLRAGVALAVGAVVFVFAIVAADSRNPDPVSDEMTERSLPDGHGRNVVNVILVDFRGIDTLGEITVLSVASIGAVALARAGRRRARPPVVEP